MWSGVQDLGAGSLGLHAGPADNYVTCEWATYFIFLCLTFLIGKAGMAIEFNVQILTGVRFQYVSLG